MKGTRAWPALRGISRDASKAPITESWNPLRAATKDTGAAGYWNSFATTSVELSKVYDRRRTDNEAARRILLPDFKKIDGSVRKVASRAVNGIIDDKKVPKYEIAHMRHSAKVSEKNSLLCRIGLVQPIRISSMSGGSISYIPILRDDKFDDGATLLVNMLLNSRALIFIARVMYTSSDNYTRYPQRIFNFSEEVGAAMSLVRASINRAEPLEIRIDNEVDSFTAATKLVGSWTRKPFRVPVCEWLDGTTNDVKDGHLRDVVEGGLRGALNVIKCPSTKSVTTVVNDWDGTKRAAYVLEFEAVREVDVSLNSGSLAHPIACRNGFAKLSCMLMRHSGVTRLAVFDRRRAGGRRGAPWTVSVYGQGVVSTCDVSKPIRVYALLFDVELEADKVEVYPRRPEALMKWDPRARKKVIPSKDMKVDMDKDDGNDSMVSEDSGHGSEQDSPHGDESE